MLDLTKKNTPSAILVDGVYYRIQTDFSYWLNFGKLIEEKKISTLEDIRFLLIDLPPVEQKDNIIKELLTFLNPPRELPRSTGDGSSTKVYDFFIDSNLIFAAFWERYDIDLLDPNLHLHWHKFLALFEGLHDTKLNEIMGYRCYNENDKTDYKDSMVNLRNAWKLETPLTEEEEKAIEEFNMLFE